MKRLSDERKLRGVESSVRTAVDLREARPRHYESWFRRVLAQAQREGMAQIFVVLYCRVSWRDKKIEHQLEKLRQRVMKLAKLSGIEVVILGEHGERVSG